MGILVDGGGRKPRVGGRKKRHSGGEEWSDREKEWEGVTMKNKLVQRTYLKILTNFLNLNF